MKVLGIVLMSSMATAASAVAAISAHVCRTISNRDKTRSLDQMAQLLNGCPPEECESVAEAIAKVADSLFPQPPPTLPVRSSRHRGRGESALSRCRPRIHRRPRSGQPLLYSDLMWLRRTSGGGS